MKDKLYHPAWRIVFAVGFVAFSSSYVVKIMNVEEPQFWAVLKYVIGFSAVIFGIIQVMLSATIRIGEKITWCISFLFLPPNCPSPLLHSV